MALIVSETISAHRRGLPCPGVTCIARSSSSSKDSPVPQSSRHFPMILTPPMRERVSLSRGRNCAMFVKIRRASAHTARRSRVRAYAEPMRRVALLAVTAGVVLAGCGDSTGGRTEDSGSTNQSVREACEAVLGEDAPELRKELAESFFSDVEDCVEFGVIANEP